ncbi:MAG: multidrug efflux pump, partial [Kiritimatiellia bacterium]
MTLLTRWAIEHTRVTWMVIILVVVTGFLSYVNLPKAETPSFTIRNAVISTAFPGASPRRVEQLVTSVIEEAVQEIPEIDDVKSVSRSGVSIVTVVIRDEVPELAPVFADLQSAIDDAQSDLPAEARASKLNTDVARTYEVLLGISNDGFDRGEVLTAAKSLKSALLLVGDASTVEIFGEQERQIHLEFEPARLAQASLSPEAITGALRGTNILTPGGEVQIGAERLSVEPSGAFIDPESIRDLSLTLPSGGIARLGDLVRVIDTFENPPSPRAYVNGLPGLMIGVQMAADSDSQVFGADVREQTRRIQAQLPIGLEIVEISFQPDDTALRLNQFLFSIGQSILIVFVVILLFLGLRTGSLVSASVPLVMLATFMLMAWFAVGIDQMSLAALLLALGMLVDNAIVMSEATIVRAQAGQSVKEAVISAAGELWVPLLISSLTTCTAFLPVYLAPGGASEFVAPIFMVVVMALMSSWLIALTLMPALTVGWLKVPPVPDVDPYDTRFYNQYRRVVRAAIRYRYAVAGAAIALLIGAGFLFGQVRNEFFAPSDSPVFTVSITTPESTTDADAEQMRRDLHNFIEEELAVTEDRPRGVVGYSTILGSGLPRFTLSYSAPEKAPGTMAMYVRTSHREDVEPFLKTLTRWTEERILGARIEGGPLVMGPGGGAAVGISVSASDDKELWTAVDAVTEDLRAR